MRKQNKKFSFDKNSILLIFVVLICISAVGATWAVLKSVATPVVNRFSEAVKYEISYNLNGGIDPNNKIDSETYVDDGTRESYTFKVTNNKPILDEYQFLGWADTADADTAVYSEGTEITLSKRSPKKTVYAVWKAVVPEERNDFQLEFDANVPEGVSASVAVPGAIEKNSGGDSYTFNVSNALAKDYNVDNTGMRFLGWSTSEFGDVIYACNEEKPSISVTVNPGTTTLFAVWGFDYYIIYDRNVSDGSVIKYQKDNNSYLDNQEAITVKLDYNNVSVSGIYADSGYIYRRPEHMLIGFAATANGTQPLQSVTIPKAGKNNALTVYSIWEDGSYALIYDANGGKYAPEAEIVITTATSHIFKVTSEKPVKADNAEANFLGWAADPEAKTADPVYAEGKEITLTEDNPTMTLYAVWEYTYRLDFNAGNATGDVPKEIVIGPTTDKSVMIEVPKEPIPVRDQYEFDYWAASEERVSGEHRYYDIANYSRMITLHSNDTNVTMYARMKPTNGVTLYYSNNNGNNSWHLETTNDNTQDFCSFTITDRVPTRTNYTFLGWAESTSATTPTLQAGDVVKIDGDVAASKTVYAVWKRHDRMRVYINFNGGSYDVTTGSGCNAQTTTRFELYGDYEYILPGETTHNFSIVEFENANALGTKKYIPERPGYSMVGFAYVDEEGRLVTNITVQEADLCTTGGVRGFQWRKDWEDAELQSVSGTRNADGSYDYTLTAYIIWARNAAQDKYVVNLDKNHSSNTSGNVSASQYVKQVEKEATDDEPAVVNTSYTFAASNFSLSSLANSRTGYKLLGFARTRDATSTEWAVNGSTLQNSITVSQDDPDVVFVNGDGKDGGSSYTLNLYAVWERQQIYKIHADFGIGSYSASSTTYKEYSWSSMQPLNQNYYTWSAPSMNGTPSKNGYKFLGFSTDPNATIPKYTVSNNTLSPAVTVSQDNPLVVKSTSDNVDTWTLNLYAVYEKQRLFNLTLDFNGGTYNSMTSETLRRQASSEQPMYTFSNTNFYYPSRYGYKLIGLASSPDATEAEYSLSSSGVVSPAVEFDTNVLTPVINSDGVEVYSQTLYAIWEEQRVFGVHVDANGGSYSSDAVTKVTKTTNIDVPSVTWDAGTLSIATPSKTDFRFLGYAYTKDATVPDFTVSSGKIVEDITVSETGDYVVNDTSTIPNISTLTLYAVWEPVKYYRLCFDLGDVTYIDSSGNRTNEIIITSNGQSLNSSTYTFTNPSYRANSSVYRSGYYHYGYTDIENGTTPIFGSVSSSGSSTPYTYTLNGSVQLMENTDGVTIEKLENGVTYVTKTFWPIWGIRLFYYNGSNLPASVIKYNADAENRVFDIEDKVPTNNNFQFAGWTTSSSSMVPQYGVNGYVSSSVEPLATQFTLNTSNDTGYLYAVWWQKYTISYDANGGMENTTPGRESAYTTLNYGSSSTSHTFEIGKNIPIYDENNSRQFLGWSTNQTATTATYQPGEDIQISGKSDGSETPTTLYAVWAEAVEQTSDSSGDNKIVNELYEKIQEPEMSEQGSIESEPKPTTASGNNLPENGGDTE